MVRTERGAGDEFATDAAVEPTRLALARAGFGFNEGVPERFEAVAVAATAESVLRFFAGGSLLTVLAVPFFPADLGGRFLGIEDLGGISTAVSVDGTGTEDSRSGDWARDLSSCLSMVIGEFVAGEE